MSRNLIRSLAFLTLSFTTTAITLDLNSHESVQNAASIAAQGVIALYNGNQTGGVLGKWPYPPYYWWESGGAWGSIMHYWAFSRNTTYNDVMMQALVSQLGPKYDFVRVEEAYDLGNDDQAFWTFAAMSAAEYGFPDPPAPAPPWITVVENVWADYVSRWNFTYCNGGLKWQIYPMNAGYTYRNSISNGAFFQLSARLARFTGNEIYVDWSNRIWNWMRGVGLIDDIYNIFDGTDELINCSRQDHHQWSYNVGVMLYGSAVLSNLTNASQIWVDRTAGLTAAVDTFVSPFANATDVIFEASCELDSTCNTDQLSMKAYLARWLADTSLMAPYTANRIGTILRASALGAAASCTGGSYNTTCGSKWYINAYDGIAGLGQELSALEIFTSLLVNYTSPPAPGSNITIPIYVPTPSLPSAIAQSSANSSTSTARPLYDSPRTGIAARNSLPTLAALLPVLAQLVR